MRSRRLKRLIGCLMVMTLVLSQATTSAFAITSGEGLSSENAKATSKVEAEQAKEPTKAKTEKKEEPKAAVKKEAAKAETKKPEVKKAETPKVVVSSNTDKKVLSYGIAYYKGNELADYKMVKQEVSADSSSDKVTVEKDIEIPADKFKGYTYDTDKTGTVPQKGQSIESGTEVKVYYTEESEVKQSAAKADSDKKVLSYGIAYYKGSELADYKMVKQEVAADSDAEQVEVQADISAPTDKFKGYTLNEKKTGDLPKKGETIETGTEVAVYYAKAAKRSATTETIGTGNELLYTVQLYMNQNNDTTPSGIAKTIEVYGTVNEDGYFDAEKNEKYVAPRKAVHGDFAYQYSGSEAHAFDWRADINNGDNPMYYDKFNSLEVPNKESLPRGITFRMYYINDPCYDKLDYKVNYLLKTADGTRPLCDSRTFSGPSDNGMLEVTAKSLSLNIEDAANYQLDEKASDKYNSESKTVSTDGTGSPFKEGDVIKCSKAGSAPQTTINLYYKAKDQSAQGAYYIDLIREGDGDYEAQQTETITIPVSKVDGKQVTIESPGETYQVETKKYKNYVLDRVETEGYGKYSQPHTDDMSAYQKAMPKVNDTLNTGTRIKIYYKIDCASYNYLGYTVKHVFANGTPEGELLQSDTKSFRLPATDEKTAEFDKDLLKLKAPNEEKYELISSEATSDPDLDLAKGTIRWTQSNKKTIVLYYKEKQVQPQPQTITYKVEHLVVGNDTPKKTESVSVALEDAGQESVAVTLNSVREMSIAGTVVDGQTIGAINSIWWVDPEVKENPLYPKMKDITEYETVTVKNNHTIQIYYSNNPNNPAKTGSYTINHILGDKNLDQVVGTKELKNNKMQILPGDMTSENAKGYNATKYTIGDGEPQPITGVLPVVELGDNGVVNIYYEEKAVERTISYTVKHKVENADVDTPELWTETKEEIVVKKPSEKAYLNVDSSHVSPRSEFTDAHYKIKSITTEPLVAETGDALTMVEDGTTITVLYEKDEPEQPKQVQVSYTVAYQDTDGKSLSADENKVIKGYVDEGAAKVLTVGEGDLAAPPIDGYQYTGNTRPAGLKVGDTVADAATVYLIYKKDQSGGAQETEKINYTIQYYKDNIKADSESVAVEVAKGVTQAKVDKTKINVLNRYAGYTCTTTLSQIPTMIANGGVINVYYASNAVTPPPVNPDVPSNPGGDDTKKEAAYKVEYYYEEGGEYSTTPTATADRKGIVGEKAVVTDADKVPAADKADYSFDEYNPANVLEANINAEGTTTLKVYFTGGSQYYMEGTLNITNAVYKDHEEWATNKTFYAGVFEDASCTTPVTDADGNAVIIPINMGGNYQAQASGSVPTTAEGQSWYATEVNADGSIMQETELFKYTVGGAKVAAFSVPEGGSATVDMQNNFFTDTTGYYPGDDENNGGNDGNTTTTTTTKTTTASNNNAQNGNNNGTAVQTGDDSDMMPYVMMMIIAGTIAAAALLRRKIQQ